ncbi:MAG: tRNA threonylcarbamoyladenosine dehydratase [Prolixibacteraceae bacterium]|nr:tRNA threonylcarbamoyladenosine dehydratase [Prolixibacteraceae bacterium]MBN2774744.1 tRNA threonylcarbamoyladenosine dehydratase [Prolixibacteraceae bacterium]
MDWLNRTELLIGPENLKKLNNTNVLIVGLGGVGAYAAEQLCRAGIGKMTIVDGDIVEATNKNRQLPALTSNEGKAKTAVLAERFKDINHEIDLTVINDYISVDKTAELLKAQKYDYVVDAIDTLSPKVFLIYHSLQMGYKIISSMGSGGKTDPSKVQIADISKSYNCKLAKMLRKRLSRMGINKGITVVFSSEEIPKIAVRIEAGKNKKSVVGTISYMPPVFGCFIASAVIRDIINEQ